MPFFTPVLCRGLLLLILFVFINSLWMYAHTGAPITHTNDNGPAAAPVKKIYDEDAKSWYAIYNTGNSIHVYLAVTDPVQQQKIIMNGIDLWIDSKGKKNKKTGILFPLAMHRDNNSMPAAPPPNFSRPENNTPAANDIPFLKKMIAGQREMKLTGFKEDLNGIQNISHPSGVQVALYFLKDTLVYEAQLPLNILPETVFLHSRISIGIVEKGMEGAGFGGNSMPPPGGEGDGMMPPAPGAGPGRGDGMEMFEDDIIWYKLSLQAEGS